MSTAFDLKGVKIAFEKQQTPVVSFTFRVAFSFAEYSNNAVFYGI